MWKRGVLHSLFRGLFKTVILNITIINSGNILVRSLTVSVALHSQISAVPESFDCIYKYNVTVSTLSLCQHLMLSLKLKCYFSVNCYPSSKSTALWSAANWRVRPITIHYIIYEGGLSSGVPLHWLVTRSRTSFGFNQKIKCMLDHQAAPRKRLFPFNTI